MKYSLHPFSSSSTSEYTKRNQELKCKTLVQTPPHSSPLCSTLVHAISPVTLLRAPSTNSSCSCTAFSPCLTSSVHSSCWGAVGCKGGASTGAICFAISCVRPLSGDDDGFVSRFLIIWVTASSPGLADHIGRLNPLPRTAFSSLHISSSIFFQS